MSDTQAIQHAAMAPTDWKTFTPATIDKAKCMARTWGGAKGGQCARPHSEKSAFCAIHEQDEKYKVHGRVDGPIPAAKLAEFVSASQKPEKAPLTGEQLATRAAKRKANADAGNADGGDKGIPKRSKKDPNAPKRLVGGAFGCFLAANREAFAKQCPGSAVTGVTKLASAKWKEASEADKKKYQRQYEDKKAAYEKAMESYVPPAEEAEEEALKGEDESEEEPANVVKKPAAAEVATKKKAAGR